MLCKLKNWKKLRELKYLLHIEFILSIVSLTFLYMKMHFPRFVYPEIQDHLQTDDKLLCTIDFL